MSGFCILLAACAMAGAQTRYTGTLTIDAAPVPGPRVLDAPYAGEEQWERVQTLTDGTRVATRRTGRKIFRDAEGRMRTEGPVAEGEGVKDIPVVVHISDPVAGIHYVLDTRNKVAHRMPQPVIVNIVPAGDGAGLTATRNTPVQPNVLTERLALTDIDGIMAEGARSTYVYNEGFQTTSESWVAPDLKILVMSRSVDARHGVRYGESTFRIANLKRGSQDVNLFLPPLDYTVVDETGAFTIRYQ
jgi:hypothetical protein